MASWPSTNLCILLGKISKVTRIQWADGSTTALINLVTQRVRITPKGFAKAFDHHQVEVSPGETFFGKAWEGALVQFRGQITSFPFKPKGALTDFNRHVLKAQAFQVLLPSEREKTIPSTVLRDYTQDKAELAEGHTHEQTVEGD